MTLGGVDTSIHAVENSILFARLLKPRGWYTVMLLDVMMKNPVDGSVISIGGDKSKYNANKGTIVDSGTTDTYLPRAVAGVFKAMYKKISGLDFSNSAVALSQQQYSQLPTLVYRMEGYHRPGETAPIIEIECPPSSYMEAMSQGGVPNKKFSNRIYLTEVTGVVLGANFMNDYNVIFDPEGLKIGFAKSDCRGEGQPAKQHTPKKDHSLLRMFGGRKVEPPKTTNALRGNQAIVAATPTTTTATTSTSTTTTTESPVNVTRDYVSSRLLQSYDLCRSPFLVEPCSASCHHFDTDSEIKTSSGSSDQLEYEYWRISDDGKEVIQSTVYAATGTQTWKVPLCSGNDGLSLSSSLIDDLDLTALLSAHSSKSSISIGTSALSPALINFRLQQEHCTLYCSSGDHQPLDSKTVTVQQMPVGSVSSSAGVTAEASSASGVGADGVRAKPSLQTIVVGRSWTKTCTANAPPPVVPVLWSLCNTFPRDLVDGGLSATSMASALSLCLQAVASEVYSFALSEEGKTASTAEPLNGGSMKQLYRIEDIQVDNTYSTLGSGSSDIKTTRSSRGTAATNNISFYATSAVVHQAQQQRIPLPLDDKSGAVSSTTTIEAAVKIGAVGRSSPDATLSRRYSITIHTVDCGSPLTSTAATDLEQELDAIMFSANAGAASATTTTVAGSSGGNSGAATAHVDAPPDASSPSFLSSAAAGTTTTASATTTTLLNAHKYSEGQSESELEEETVIVSMGMSLATSHDQHGAKSYSPEVESSRVGHVSRAIAYALQIPDDRIRMKAPESSKTPPSAIHSSSGSDSDSRASMYRQLEIRLQPREILSDHPSYGGKDHSRRLSPSVAESVRDVVREFTRNPIFSLTLDKFINGAETNSGTAQWFSARSVKFHDITVIDQSSRQYELNRFSDVVSSGVYWLIASMVLLLICLLFNRQRREKKMLQHGHAN